uniref:Uncharacterized protein n=1 Tax=Panagrolaimus sp. ES5 TaxID=591445 RepID=A0AC34FM79_9BILA
MKMMRIQDEEDGDKIVTFDRIIRELPKLDSFTLVFHIATDYTKITEALKLCDIKNLKLGNIESNFNVKAFFDYLMTQEKMQVFLCFRDLSWENRNALQEFVDQLIESGIKITPKPFLNFPGQTQKTANALEKLSSI